MENKELTTSQIRYIVWLHRLSCDGSGVKNVDLATALGFSKSSVHNMLRSLSEMGILRQEYFGMAFLTDYGRALAHKYSYCYGILEEKISQICGIGTVSENSIFAILADMTEEKLEKLYGRR